MEIDRDISPGDEADRADYYRESAEWEKKNGCV